MAQTLNKAKDTIQETLSILSMNSPTNAQSHFMQNHRSPAQIAAETAGVVKPVISEPTNSSKHVTSLYGNPWPAYGAHALNVGGMLVTSDPFFLKNSKLLSGRRLSNAVFILLDLVTLDILK